MTVGTWLCLIMLIIVCLFLGMELIVNIGGVVEGFNMQRQFVIFVPKMRVGLNRGVGRWGGGQGCNHPLKIWARGEKGPNLMAYLPLTNLSW